MLFQNHQWFYTRENDQIRVPIIIYYCATMHQIIWKFNNKAYLPLYIKKQIYEPFKKLIILEEEFIW
jgi:hypothetical protein